MNLKPFCAVERINDETISPAQSDDCQDDLQTVVVYGTFRRRRLRDRNTHTRG